VGGGHYALRPAGESRLAARALVLGTAHTILRALALGFTVALPVEAPLGFLEVPLEHV